MQTETWTLQPKFKIRGKPEPLYWTGQDYTTNVDAAQKFTSKGDAERFLQTHGHLRASLQPAEVKQQERQTL